MTKYRVASIMYPSLNSSLDGISADMFFYGCSRKCEGCHNKELQEFVEPTVTLSSIISTIKKTDKAKVINLMGGEPIEQDNLIELTKALKDNGKKVCMFTSSEFEQVPQGLLEELDYLKTGEYQENNKTKFGSFLASKNQKMWKKEGGSWTIQWEG